MNQMMSASSNENQKKKKDENPEPNYNQLMDELKHEIINVYPAKETQNDSDIHAKQAIQILHEIEIKINNYVKELQYIHMHGNNEKDDWVKKILYEEKARKDKRFADQKRQKEINEK